MREAERLLERIGCPKLNIQVRAHNHGVVEFYKRMGYAVEDHISMGNLLSPKESLQRDKRSRGIVADSRQGAQSDLDEVSGAG